MLLSKEESMSSLRIAVGSCVLVLALGTGTWGAVRAVPLMTGVVVPDQNPPRDPVNRPPEHVLTFADEVAALKPIRLGGPIKPPIKTRDVKPVYPPDAQANGIQGVVIIEALIDTNGKVVDARVLRSIPALDAAALGAVKQWEFTPTLVNGVPANILMTTTVNFTRRGPKADDPRMPN
jgi:TonB family protein